MARAIGRDGLELAWVECPLVGGFVLLIARDGAERTEWWGTWNELAGRLAALSS